MSMYSADLLKEPSVTSRQGETLYCWGDRLGVIVLASGEIGQFATSLPWTRSQVENFLASRGMA